MNAFVVCVIFPFHSSLRCQKLFTHTRPSKNLFQDHINYRISSRSVANFASWFFFCCAFVLSTSQFFSALLFINFFFNFIFLSSSFSLSRLKRCTWCNFNSSKCMRKREHICLLAKVAVFLSSFVIKIQLRSQKNLSSILKVNLRHFLFTPGFWCNFKRCILYNCFPSRNNHKAMISSPM